MEVSTDHEQAVEVIEKHALVVKVPPLPVEIILQILSYLDVSTILTISTISKCWNYSCSDIVLLRSLLSRSGWSSDNSIRDCTDVTYIKRRLYLEAILGTFIPGQAALDLISISDMTEIVATNAINNITTSTCQRFSMVCAKDKVSTQDLFPS